MTKDPPKSRKIVSALTIAGSDSGGGAGIQIDLQTFRALGVHGTSVLTALTAQNTKGVKSILEVPPEFVEEQMDAVLEDFEIGWAKTGMLYSKGVIEAVHTKAREHGLRLVIDPVMMASTGAPLLNESAEASLRAMISFAELVTPNVPEAEKLSNLKIRSVQEMKKSAERIGKLGAKAVLVKGGHLEGSQVVDVLYTKKGFEVFKNPRVRSGPVHGTGCSLSAAITAELAKGNELCESVARAIEFVRVSIANRINVGKGLPTLDPLGSLIREAERGNAVEEVWKAAELLVSDPKFSALLPEVGTNVVMALPNSTDPSEVVGLSGRIVKVSGSPHLTGFPKLGGSKHVARMVLTAMRFDPTIRAGMNIRFSNGILKVCRKLGLEIGEFDRAKEPKGTKTMVWGIESIVRRMNRVPRVVVDRGAHGKEAMIRLLGTTPTEVAGLALRIASMLEG